MKHVVLIGDSIRESYQDRVRMKLRGRARVWTPPENGMHSTNLLLHFWDWIEQQQPDVLHINAGLWDVRRLMRDGTGGNVVPIDQYEQNLDRLLGMVQQRTSARMIWATTTPVTQERLERFHEITGHPGRRGSDIPEYNARALTVAKKHGIAINDLHALVVQHGPEQMISPDGVHYTPEGAAILAGAVAEVVSQHL